MDICCTEILGSCRCFVGEAGGDVLPQHWLAEHVCAVPHPAAAALLLAQLPHARPARQAARLPGSACALHHWRAGQPHLLPHCHFDSFTFQDSVWMTCSASCAMLSHVQSCCDVEAPADLVWLSSACNIPSYLYTM